MPRKFFYIFKVPNRIASSVRESNFDVSRKILNKLVSSCLVFVDDLANGVIEYQQFLVNTNGRFVLCCPNLLFDGFNCMKILI